MTFDHVGNESIKDLVAKLTGTQGTLNVVTDEMMKQFYKNRIDSLDKQSCELIERHKLLEQEMIKEIQQILIEKGADLLSATQMIQVVCKELGACEIKLMELEDNK